MISSLSKKLSAYIRSFAIGAVNFMFPFGVISLPVGEKKQIPLAWLPNFWKMESKNIKLKNGCLFSESDQVGKESRGTLYFLGKVKVPVTIVPWKVDCGGLVFNEPKGQYTILGVYYGKVYFTDDRTLYEAGLNFKNPKKITNLAWKQKYRSDRSLLLKTPVGWFLRTDGGVIHSPDLQQWEVAIDLGSRGMFQHLAYISDSDDHTTYIFATEYTTDPERRHGIYRGTYNSKGCIGWKKVYEFYSSVEGRASQQNLPSARHIHVLTVDKNNWLWVATGDSDSESGIFVSTDLGNSFKIFAAGSQQYRTLMLMFTENYLYWNMDTHLQDQKVFRVCLDKLQPNIINALPDAAAVSFSSDRTITPSGIEQVGVLPYGAQWYGIFVKNQRNEKVLLMSASPESQVPETGEQPHRDWNARIFAIKNLDEKYPEITEVASIPPKANLRGKDRRYCRVDPRCQDDKGNVYFMGHNAKISGAVTARLNF